MRRLALFLLGLAAPATAQTVDATAYGVVPDPTVDNGPALERAARAAVAGREPGRWAVLQLPCGTIGYEGRVTINPDSLEIRGCGGARVTRAVGPDGVVYFPVRDVAERGLPETRLRVRDTALQRTFEAAQRGLNPPPTSLTVAAAPGGVAPTRRQHRLVLRDLVLDGNDAAQMDAIRHAMTAAPQWTEDWLRNAPGFTGLSASNQNNVDLCADATVSYRDAAGRVIYNQMGRQPGLRVVLDGVSITGYAATGILGGTCTRWTLTEVRLGNTAYNHSAYATDGVWRDVTLTGYAWTHVVTQYDLDVERLVVEQPARSPLGRDGPEVFDVRSGALAVRGLTMYTALADEAPGPALDATSRIAVTREATQLDLSDVRWAAGRVEGLWAGSGMRASAERVRLVAPGGVLRIAWASPAQRMWDVQNTRPDHAWGLYLRDVAITASGDAPSLIAAAEDGAPYPAVVLGMTVNGRPALVQAHDAVTVTDGPLQAPPPTPGPPPLRE